MNMEAFKLARDTLRTAVKEYGWHRRNGESSLARPLGSGRIFHRPYRAELGKFEGEHWSIVHYYDAMMNGCADEPLYSGETCVADLFEVSDVERAAFAFKPETTFVALWHSESGFESLQELTATEYDDLRAQYDESEEEEEQPTKYWFTTSSGRIELQLTLDDARSGSQPGKDAEEDIAVLRKLPYIAEQLDKLQPATLRAELAEYGTWDEAELADHDRNLTRILWLACGDVREEQHS